MADPRPFMEIAAGFDPNMPEEQYEAVRQKYFNDVIMPRLSRGSSATAAWTQFKQKTERPGKLTGMARAIVPVAQAATGFTATFTRPLPNLAPQNEALQKLAARAQQAEDYVSKVAAREGIGQHIPLVGTITGLGELAGMTPYFALAEETGGETLGAVLPELGKTVLGRVATRGLLGGAAVGTYESIAAKDGERFTAGAKGFATGAVMGAGLGLLGGGVGSVATKLKSRGLATNETVDEIVRNHLAGEGPVNPEVDKILDQELKDTQQASNHVEGRPRDIRENARVKGVVISGRTTEGDDAQPWVVRVTPGGEKDAAKRVIDYARKGGVVEDVLHNPDALDSLRKFMQASVEEGAERYKGARILHAPGDAPGVASEMRINGEAAIASDNDHVLVQDPVRASPTDSEIDDAVRQLKKPDPENPGQELDLTKADRLLMRKSIKALWDNDIPDEAKEPHAQLLSHWDLKDMIPSKWRRMKVVPEMTDVPAGQAREPAVKRIWEMSPEELEAAETADRTADQRMLQEFFGEEGAKRYQRLQRKSNSSTAPQADIDAADRELGDMEEKLTQEQQNRLFGIGETGPTWEDYRDFRQHLDRISGDTPEELGESMQWAITGMGEIRDPAAMGIDEQMRYAQLRHGFEIAERQGWDKNAVLQSALRGAAGRFGPDAEFMLRQFIKPEGREPRPVEQPRLGTGEAPEQARVESKSRQNLWQEGEPLRKLDESREFLESAPPELRQGMRAEARGEYAPWGGLHIPESEQYTVERNPEGGIRRITYPTGQTLERGELYSTMRIGAEEMQKLFGGKIGEIKGTVVGPEELTKVAKALGLSIPSEFGEPNVPAMLLAPHASEMTETHEAMHIYKHTVPALASIMEKGGQVESEIGKALRGRSPVYSVMPLSLLNEEAFVHAGTAILHGDARALAELVLMNGTLEDVMRMVRERSADIFNALPWDAVDGAPERIIQRQMGDLLRRTTSKEEGDLAWELMNSAEDQLKDYHYDPQSRMWKYTSSGRERVYSARKDMLDDIAKESAAKDWAPSASLWAEMSGVRGPIVPRGEGPVKDAPLVDRPPDIKWSPLFAADHMIRSFGNFVADLDRRVNEALAPHGKKFDLYNPFKDVADHVRDRGAWMKPLDEELDDVSKGALKRQPAWMDTLAEDPKYWEKMVDEYQLPHGDLDKLRRMNELINQLDATDPEMKIRDFLTRDWKNFRSSGREVDQFFDFANRDKSSLSPIEQMIRDRRLDPRARHAGSFVNAMIREVGDRKFTQESLAKFEKVVNATAKNGKPMLGFSRIALQRNIDYLRNQPDVTGQIITKFTQDFLDRLGKRFEQANKYLPSSMAKLPTDLGLSQVWIDRLIAWSYAAGIGLRAAVPLRDLAMTFVTGLPVLGPGRFARGLARAMTREGWNFADEQGALLGHRSMRELYGDRGIDQALSESTPDKISRIANKLMAPSRWGHNPGRALVFNGEYGDALDAVGRYRRGEITFDELKHMSNTSLWWTDKQFQDRIHSQLEDRGGFTDHDIARNMAHEILDLTLFPYRAGMQPLALQTGVGRIAFQYGLWPMNYLDFLRRAAGKWREPGNKMGALQVTATWWAVNYAAVSSMAALGVDVKHWFWQSDAGIGLGPTAQFVQNLGLAMKETPEGRDARAQLPGYLLQFFPTQVEAKNIWDAIETGGPFFDSNGVPTAESWKLFGFTPLKDTPSRDLEDQMLYELGYSRTSSGAIRRTLVERERPPVQ